MASQAKQDFGPVRAAALVGVVLAGGEGRRMGPGVPKPVRPLGGRPMVAYVVERLRPQVMDLVVVANDAMPGLSRLGVPVIALVLAATAIPVEVRPLGAAPMTFEFSDIPDIMENVAGYLPVGIVLGYLVVTRVSSLAEPMAGQIVLSLLGAAVALLIAWFALRWAMPPEENARASARLGAPCGA